MSRRSPQSRSIWLAVALMSAVCCMLPTTARSQSRGSLPVTATVLASATMTGPAQALVAAGEWVQHRPVSNDAATLAQVSIVSASAQGTPRAALVVGVSYLQN